MFPRNISYYCINTSSCNIVFFSKFISRVLSWYILSSNFFYIFFSKPRKMAGFTSINKFWMNKAFMSFSFCTSILRNSILYIIKLSSYEQMFWINTSRIITLMKNKFINRYFSKVNFPRESMGKYPLLSHAYISVFTIPSPYCSYPKPTSGGFVNFIKESCFNIHIYSICHKV